MSDYDTRQLWDALTKLEHQVRDLDYALRQEKARTRQLEAELRRSIADVDRKTGTVYHNKLHPTTR